MEEAESAERSQLEEAEEPSPREMTGDGEDSRLPTAPDVTYDATVIEQNQSEPTAPGGDGEKEKEEGSEKENKSAPPKEKAVRFKEEVEREGSPPEKSTDGDRGDKKEREEEDEWMDILGSGDLKKKVGNPYSMVHYMAPLTVTVAAIMNPRW